jgi:predicted ATPase/DNA-binding SARP family transcriptional activator
MSVVMSQTGSFSPRLTTLGGLYLKPKGFQRPKLLLLLTYLALEHGKSREHLRSLFWAGATDVSASLRVALAQIRNALPDALEDSGSILLTRIPCDVVDLQTALDASDWERAVELYTGAFLDGVMLSEFGNELEEWVLTTREYLAGRVVEAHLRLAEQALGHNDLENVKRHANQAHKLPGAPPPEEDTLTRLHNILNAIKSPSAAELRREAAELGLELSIASTTPSIAPAPTNLPAPTSSFIARETERRYLLETLKDPEARLVTVTGTGGMGKSRLALEVARQLHRDNRFKDGVFVAFLEVIESVDAVVSELLRVLQVPIESGQDPQTKLLEHLQTTETLLVLDNIEHLIPVASQLEQLLEACPKLKVLTTSRERLGLTAEWLLPLEGLPVPSSTEAKPNTPFGAVELFAARAKRQAPAFSLPAQYDSVLEICRLVEGLPLAIELAAALIRAITLPELIEAIKQHPDALEGAINDPHERHHGMRAVFEQSWKLLTPTEQRTLARMAVFKDGATREAVMRITEANLIALIKLVEKSLVQLEENSRYRIHPLLGEYIIEKLKSDSRDEQNTQEKHVKYYINLLENALVLLNTQKSRQEFEIVEKDYNNILTAWEHGLKLSNIIDAEKLQDTVILFERLGRVREGITLFQKTILALSFIDSSKDDKLKLALAIFLVNAAWLHFRLGQHENAQEFAERAAKISRDLGNSGLKTLSQALNTLSGIANDTNNINSAIQYGQEAIEIARKLGDKRRETMCLINLATAEGESGLVEKSQTRFLQALEAAEKHDDFENIGLARLNLADLMLHQESSNLTEIQTLLESGLHLIRSMKILSLESNYHLNLVELYIQMKSIAKAHHHVESATQLMLLSVDPNIESRTYMNLGRILQIEGKIIDAQYYYYLGIEKAWKIQNCSIILTNMLFLAIFEATFGSKSWAENALNVIYNSPNSNVWQKRKSIQIIKEFKLDKNNVDKNSDITNIIFPILHRA